MANNTVTTYDPNQVAVIVGGNIIKGFSDGTFVQVERNAEMWNLRVGCDGYSTRVKSNNKSGRITITLQQSSPSVDALSALAVADELSNTGAVPALVRDASGRSVCSTATAWIVKMPNAEFGKEASDRVFVLEAGSLEMFSGGNGS